MNPSPLAVAIVTAIATAGAAHIFASLRSWCRRRRRRDNLRTILISELRSNSEGLWLVFAVNEHAGLFFSVPDIQPEKDSAATKSKKNKERKKAKITFLSKQSDAGLYYTQHEAVTGQIGALDRPEVQAIQTAYQNIKAFENSLEKLPPIQQYIGEGDNILTLERTLAIGEIEANAQKALAAHLEAIKALGGELTDIEERQLEVANEQFPNNDDIEQINERVFEND